MVRKLNYHCHLLFNERVSNFKSLTEPLNFFAVLPTVQPDKIDRFFIGFERNSNDCQHFRPHHDRGTGAHRCNVWRRKANAPHPVDKVFCLGVIYLTFIANKKSIVTSHQSIQTTTRKLSNSKNWHTSRDRDQDHPACFYDEFSSYRWFICCARFCCFFIGDT